MLKLIRGLINLPANFPGCVASMGNFDGVHLGHQALINRLAQKSRELALPMLLITFEPQPNEFFATAETIPARLTSLREKCQALGLYGANYVLCLRFNAQLANLSAADFVQHILKDKLKVAHMVVGDDFHFGHRRAGNLQTLQQAGLSAESMPSYTISTSRVSSSQIRAALQHGDLATAAALLGREYSLSGRVIHGQKRGRSIGFPTANVALQRKAAALSGVYAVKIIGLTDHPLYGVANIGTRPTLDGTHSLLEAHIFDFCADIYGKMIQVVLVKKLRAEQRFDSFDLLHQQILADAEQSRSYFNLG